MIFFLQKYDILWSVYSNVATRTSLNFFFYNCSRKKFSLFCFVCLDQNPNQKIISCKSRLSPIKIQKTEINNKSLLLCDSKHSIPFHVNTYIEVRSDCQINKIRIFIETYLIYLISFNFSAFYFLQYFSISLLKDFWRRNIL